MIDKKILSFLMVFFLDAHEWLFLRVATHKTSFLIICAQVNLNNYLIPSPRSPPPQNVPLGS